MVKLVAWIQAASRRILYVGDTGYHEQFVGVGPVDLAMIGIGAYNPYIEGHASREQAWRMTRHAEARHVLPMHHGTFLLSLEPPDEPLRRLLAAAGSAEHDSFSDGLLEYPQYTRPVEFEGMRVPDILLSGNHQAIAAWRRREQLRRTLQRRPDLLAHALLSEDDLKVLAELRREIAGDQP